MSSLSERRAKKMLLLPILNQLPRRKGGGNKSEVLEVHCWVNNGHKHPANLHPLLLHLPRKHALLALFAIVLTFLSVKCVIQLFPEFYKYVTDNALRTLSNFRKQKA
jgi:hypothetical protein